MKNKALYVLCAVASTCHAQENPDITSIMEAAPRVSASTVEQEPSLVIPTPPVMEQPQAQANQDYQKSQAEDEVNIGLAAPVRQKIAALLNKLLADEYVLYTKTLKYHWNVEGNVFHDFHAAFKEQYEKLFDIVDSIAERARALGQPAAGSLQEFGVLTRLKEIDGQKLSAIEMVKQLLADHEAIIRTLRADIDETGQLGDQGTSNFLQDLIVKHEKIAWMLRATAAQ